MSILTRTDVTAVKIYNQYILAGIGSNIEVYHRNSGKYEQKIITLRGQKIYGIVPLQSTSKLLIFGGKQFTVLALNNPLEVKDNGEIFYREIDPIVCNDWIHSGVWISEDKIALLSAHNVVQIWNTPKKSLENQYISKENSILYSGLLMQLEDDIVALSGTVFSEVIIHLCIAKKSVHYLRGHKGVIFSITCKPETNMIVTTSDDRSVRIWTIDNPKSFSCYSSAYWENAKIFCAHELYGHTARVMRNCITDDYIISIGEDSRICFWDHQGALLKKLESHQNASLWSLDTDVDYLVTGGGDCGVIIHPLTLVSEYSKKDVILEIKAPKKVYYTAKNNAVIMSERNELIYYNSTNKTSVIHKLNHTSTFKLLDVSSCKQIIAVADMNGKLDVFVENCKSDEISRIIDTKLSSGKILSMHWAGNRHLVVCFEDGKISVLASTQSECEVIQSFVLPQSAERKLTAVDINVENKMLIVSNRSGHMYVYSFGIQEPLKIIHGKYGKHVTSIRAKNSEIITTDRDGSLKYYLHDNEAMIKYMRCKDLDFQWVEKFLDKSLNFVCGFQERTFIVYDLENNSRVIEVNIGGGHRSWDAIRYFERINGKCEECVKLIYIKNSVLHTETFQLSKINPTKIVNGTHSKEINCLKTLKNISGVFFISGGEDTTLRISRYNFDSRFKEEISFKQLSSIRTLRTFELEDRLLMVSAGGRAQICAKTITFGIDNVTCEEIIDYQLKGTDKMRNRHWKNRVIDFDPETRIMDLEIFQLHENTVIIYLACSDAVLRVFELDIKRKLFNFLHEIKYHKTCILKTKQFEIIERSFLVTCTTRGVVALWDVSAGADIPIFETITNKSGINCIDVEVIDDNRFLVATGGDDNAVYVVMLKMNEFAQVNIIFSWSSDRFHCSQVTGLKIIDDLVISTGVDQRITLLRLSTESEVKCDFVSQSFSDVADIHGLDIVDITSNSILVCVFGKGLEVVKVSKPAQTGYLR